MSEPLIAELVSELKTLNEKLKYINQDVFSAKEAADYLRIGYDTILRLTRIGAIEHVPNGNSYLYKKTFLEDWLEKNRKFN